MVNYVPVSKTLGIAEVAQVVAVAPYLIRQLRIAHRGTVHIVVDCVVALGKLLG